MSCGPHNNGTDKSAQPDIVWNEAMRVILGTTKYTPIKTTRFMSNLPPMQTREKVEQANAYFRVVEIPHKPIYEAVKDTNRCRLEKGKSWMGQAEDSILQVYNM